MASLALPRAEELYAPNVEIGLGREPTVTGDIPEAPKNVLKSVYRRAKAKVLNYVIGHSLKPYMKILQRDVPLFVERIEPENGLTQAYTGGDDIVVNEGVIPKTAMFARLMNQLGRSDSKLAKYLYDKLSDAVNNLEKTLRHEITHIYQIKSGFVSDVFHATRNYIKARLPKYAEPLAEILAYNFVTPPIEGLTEATVDQMGGSRTPGEIERNSDESLYGWFKRVTAMALKSAGGNKMPNDVYAEQIEGYGATKYTNAFLEHYGLGSFLNKLGRYLSPRQPQTAYATA